MMTYIKEGTITSTETSTDTTTRKEGITRRVDITRRGTMRSITAKRGITIRGIMTRTIRVTKDTMAMKNITHIITTTGRRVDMLEVRNSDTVTERRRKAVSVDLLSFVVCYFVIEVIFDKTWHRVIITKM